MNETIIKFRAFLLKHFKNRKIQTLITTFINYEMISYIFFGVGTSLVDYIIFSSLTLIGMSELISNIISSICAIIFAYITNRRWVFKSHTHGFLEITQEFIRFTSARLTTVLMTEIILIISKLLHGNAYIAKLIAMVLTIILNYLFSKLFIFNNKEKEHNNERKKTK